MPPLSAAGVAFLLSRLSDRGASFPAPGAPEGVLGGRSGVRGSFIFRPFPAPLSPFPSVPVPPLPLAELGVGPLDARAEGLGDALGERGAP